MSSSLRQHIGQRRVHQISCGAGHVAMAYSGGEVYRG
jgi:hypothetical protein